MNTRLKYLRKDQKLSQEDFGKRLGVSNTAISKLESGENNITDQMVLAICRVFDVSEEWLRFGCGEIYVPMSKDEEFHQLCTDIEFSDDDFIRNVMRAYWNLDAKEKAAVRKLIGDLSGM